MTVLKWLLIVVSVGYLGGLAAMFLLQRSILFPIPQVARTTPAAAGFPQAEEHVLTTDDGEKVIVWHMPARPGHPVIALFPRQRRFPRRLLRPLSRCHRRRHRRRRAVLSRLCRLERAAERAGTAEGRRGGLCLHHGAIQRGPDRGLGLFARHRRGGGAGGRTAGRQSDPGSALRVDRRGRRVGISDFPGRVW